MEHRMKATGPKRSESKPVTRKGHFVEGLLSYTDYLEQHRLP